MSFYTCKRCNHKTKQRVEMVRHLDRKIKCNRLPNSYQYTDEEINILSLHKNNENIDNNIDNNVDNNLDIKSINDIKSTKFICNNCNKSYSRKYNLERHILKCENNNITESNNIENNNIVNNIVNNTNNTINNIQINLKLESFDNEWDVSKINKFTRHSLLLSKIMYTNLLQNILDNENNLNVIIEKDSNVGLVYKNDADKFIKMDLKDIVDNSMDKLNKHLKDFYNESKDDEEFIIMDKIFEEQRNLIDNKYKEYKTNEETQKKVEEYITEIYDKKKEDAIKLFNQVLKQNDETLMIDGF